MKQDALAAAPSQSTPQPRGSWLIDTLRTIAPLGILIGGVLAFMTLRSMKEAPTQVAEQALAPMVETIKARFTPVTTSLCVLVWQIPPSMHSRSFSHVGPIDPGSDDEAAQASLM